MVAGQSPRRGGSERSERWKGESEAFSLQKVGVGNRGVPSSDLSRAFLDFAPPFGYKSATYLPIKEVNLLAFVVVDEGESIESALRRFKRRVQQEAIIKEIKKHAVYFKPGEKKRMKEAQARKRMRRRMKRERDIEY